MNECKKLERVYGLMHSAWAMHEKTFPEVGMAEELCVILNDKEEPQRPWSVVPILVTETIDEIEEFNALYNEVWAMAIEIGTVPLMYKPCNTREASKNVMVDEWCIDVQTKNADCDDIVVRARGNTMTEALHKLKVQIEIYNAGVEG